MVKEREIDRELVQRAQAGEKLAFGLLVTKYQRKLYRLALRIVADPAEAEDVVQETFIKAYRALPQFRGDAAFYTWLYRIAINAARSSLESRGRRLPTQSGLNINESETFEVRSHLNDVDTPETLLLNKQLAEAVNSAMEGLPAELRLTLSLREIEGLSYADIAEVMVCPIGTVRSRIFRAREAIAERIRPLLGTGVEN
jgi:RNA polymerase sigma-70 factor (ECF subfamily)